MQFHDGKFKILLLADIQDTDTPRRPTKDLLCAALDKTKPDLAVLLGDNTGGNWPRVDVRRTQKAVDAVARELYNRGVPFALVFGNHDHEGLCNAKNGMTEKGAKRLLLSMFQAYPNCLSCEGAPMTGVGNYNLLLKDSRGQKDIFNLWFFDSNPYAPQEEGGGYGYVHEDQIAWYEKTSAALTEKNGGVPLPSLLFQHIAVPEVYDLFKEVPAWQLAGVRGSGGHEKHRYLPDPQFVYEGGLREGPCSPNRNHGQFASWRACGDIVGAFFGHDHVNDFAGVKDGIHLVAVPAVTYYSYGWHHGVRTVTLYERDLKNFSSEILLYPDLVQKKVWNLYMKQHGYAEFRSRFLPKFAGTLAGAALTAGIYAAHKKNKKAN